MNLVTYSTTSSFLKTYRNFILAGAVTMMSCNWNCLMIICLKVVYVPLRVVVKRSVYELANQVAVHGLTIPFLHLASRNHTFFLLVSMTLSLKMN